MIFLYALLTSFIGSISVAYSDDKKAGYFINWIIRFVVYFVIMWLMDYSGFYPFVGRTIFMAILPMLMVSAIYVRVKVLDYGDLDSIGEKVNVGVAIVTLVFLLSTNIFSCDAFYADDLYKMVKGQQLDSKTFAHDPVSEENIREVPKETAIWKAKRMITQDGRNLGAFYKFDSDSMFIQRVNGRLYWCAPLEFGGVWRQSKSIGSSPGFVMISAVDNGATPELFTKKPNGEPYKLRYMLKSSWDLRLQRYLCRKYPNRWLMDYSFEVDEQLRPWQVVTWVEPTKWFKDGERVLGAIIVDPETGDCTEYTVDNIPNWVDRVMPQELALKYNDWFGKYESGWRACRGCSPRETDKRPAKMAGHENIWMVYGSDGDPYWFTGLTSFSDEDHSLVGKTYMDCRTGKFYYLPAGKGGSDQQGIVKAVQNALVKMNVNLKVCDPIPYNIYGRPDTWVVPVVSAAGEKDKGSEGGQLLKVAIVDGITLQPVVGDNKAQALQEFRRQLGAAGQEFAPSSESKQIELETTITSISQVIVGGESEIRFLTKDSPHTFSCLVGVADRMSTALELAKPGDKVKIKYQETKERVVPVSWYLVAGQPEVLSANQKGMIETKRQQEETEQKWKLQQQEESASGHLP